MFSNIQAIFFDLGDTLVHIRPEVLQTICNEIGQFRKKPLKPIEYIAAFQNEWNNRKTSSAKDLIREVNSVEREIEYWKDYFDTLLLDLEITSKPWDLTRWLAETYSNAQSFECFEDVHSILADLRSKELKLGLISNAFPSAQQIIKDLELEQYFQYSLLSFQDKYVKPEPEIYQFAVEKLEVDIDRAVFVDDRQSFVEAARDLGMKAYLIERFPNQSQNDELVIKSQVPTINDLFELKNEILRNEKVKRDTLPALVAAILKSITSRRDEKDSYLRISRDWPATQAESEKLPTRFYGRLRTFEFRNPGILIATLCGICWQQISAGMGLLKKFIIDHFPIEERDMYFFIFCD